MEYRTKWNVAAPPPPTQDHYSSEITGVPSHWIPFYGAAFGLFYDPLTDMFVGDGPPRHSIHRPWDGSLPSAPQTFTFINHCNQPPHSLFDNWHLQSRAFVDRFGDVMASEGKTMYFCFCVQGWRQWRHRCPPASFEMPLQLRIFTPIRRYPCDWVSRSIAVVDREYLGDVGYGASPFPKMHKDVY